MTKIAVFGLGYVGVVTMAALARGGHEVVGVDPNLTKVEMVNDGRSPVVEAGLEDLVREGVAAGRIRTTTSADDAVRSSDVSLICVGTPSNSNGSLDLTQVTKVCQEIGSVLAATTEPHVVVVRSTMLPGSTEELLIPTLEEASGRRVGSDLHVCFNPEFLREGSSIADFYDPPFTIVGSDDERATEAVSELYAMVATERQLSQRVPVVGTSVIAVPIRVAEMVKYACNAFHALKVSFANEIGAVCKQQGIDSHAVMDVFCRDTRLNISPAYLSPGFAFGGSCLPKDLRALVHRAGHLDVDTPVLSSIMTSNTKHIERAFEMVRRTGGKRVGVLGLSFKAGTDDLRESPIVELVERMIGKGYEVRIFDRNVAVAKLQGSNRSFIEQEVPHISALMRGSIDEVVDESDVIVIGNRDPKFREVLQSAGPDQTIVDLVRIASDTASLDDRYAGICW